jgi:hypothetical protein
MDIDSSSDGAKPLVDLNAGPRLDSGPRSIDSLASQLPHTPEPRPGTGTTSQLGRSAVQPMQPPMQPQVQQTRFDVAPPPPPRAGASPIIPPSVGAGSNAWTRAPSTQPVPATPPRKKNSLIKPWVVIVAILVAAGVAALVVALSGPDVTTQHK